MDTKIIKIDPTSPEPQMIKAAARIIRKGGLVVFPTETVYGLGANAMNTEAVAKIFQVKGRPADNPLIVHVADPLDIIPLTKDIPSLAEKLIEEFWPGPLTLVLKKSALLPDIITGGLDTVAVRMPDNKIALDLIVEAGLPLVAPSANLSGKTSPTSLNHVVDDLFGKVDAIIDGGDMAIGLESTVVDVTLSPPVLLRPGGYSIEELERVVCPISIPTAIHADIGGSAARSPGMKYRHYAPEASLVLVEGEESNMTEKIQILAEEYAKRGIKVGILTTKKNRFYNAAHLNYIGRNPATVAKNLFRALRQLDSQGVEIIIAEGIEERGLGLAVMNRLRKASHEIVLV